VPCVEDREEHGMKTGEGSMLVSVVAPRFWSNTINNKYGPTTKKFLPIWNRRTKGDERSVGSSSLFHYNRLPAFLKMVLCGNP
jgi:hypothetical protein